MKYDCEENTRRQKKNTISIMKQKFIEISEFVETCIMRLIRNKRSCSMYQCVENEILRSPVKNILFQYGK